MRRYSFEYNGMRNHEHYFASLQGGTAPLSAGGALEQALISKWGSYDAWLSEFKALALTRGIGWAMLTYDKETNALQHHWVDEQHLGQLQGAPIILALDLWEHSYVADYQPSGKKQYVEDFFANLNWKHSEEQFAKAQ